MRGAERGLTFVVGTGRSGSTALSQILHAHPDVLSLNELLVSLMDPDASFPVRPLTGEEFWRLLSEPNRAFDAMIRSGVWMAEFGYRPGRYSAQTTGIPKLSLMVLPHLTDDPDALFDELGRAVREWPRRSAPAHYEALFALLRDRFGRRVVVERSGHSLRWLPYLRLAFPTARFVHLHRNGPDCAVSMSRHAGFRTIALLAEMCELAGVKKSSELTPERVATLPPRLSGLLAERYDPALLWGADLPVTRFGALWSEMIRAGLDELSAIPADRRMTLSYETLLDEPDRELSRLAAFTGVAAPAGWLATGREVLDPGRRDLVRLLAPEERVALEEACAPGTAALASAGAG